MLGNPAISSFVGCFKATLINAGMPEMTSVMRNQKPLSHCSVNIQNFELWFIALLKQGLDLGNMIMFCPDVLRQDVRFAPAVDEGWA